VENKTTSQNSDVRTVVSLTEMMISDKTPRQIISNRGVEMENKSSMLYWFPKVKDLPIPQPKTEFVLSKDNWWQYLDGKRLPDQDIVTLKEAIKKIGYPVFMRTDLASGKHQYLDTSYVDSEDKVLQNLFGLIEQNALRDLWFDTIVVREFIYLSYRFRAFGGLPIGCERRYFIRDGEVICHHPYWIKDAIKFYQQSKNWENLPWEMWLKELNTESEIEVRILTNIAEMVGSILPGSWSVDFAKDRDGKWWLIDMALAEQSWHPPCKNKLSDDLKGN